MAKVEFRFLNRDQVQQVLPSVDELQSVVERGLVAHGQGQVVLPPKSHIDLDHRYNGHFNVLLGWVEPVDMAGVKVVGDYVDNYRYGLPSEVAMLTLYQPRLGVPVAVMDATDLTTARTGAVTAIGAKYLAKPGSRILGHIGARGTAFSNIAGIAHLYGLEEVRVNSRRKETREELARRIETELSIKAVPCDTVEDTVRDADIVIEATRLEKPQILIADEWLKRDCLLITYGWVMAVDPATVAGASKVVVDDWAQCCKGGQLFPMIQSGTLTKNDLHAEIGEIAARKRPGRESDDKKIVFWHRGFAISDIMVGQYVLDRARAAELGQVLTLFDRGDEFNEVKAPATSHRAQFSSRKRRFERMYVRLAMVHKRVLQARLLLAVRSRQADNHGLVASIQHQRY